MVRRIHPLLVVALLVALSVSVASAEGRVKRGVLAPDFVARATSGIEAFSMPVLRGRFVFLMFFSVHCKHCQKFVPRLDEIDARFGARGLRVVAVTRESMDEVRSFRRTHGLRGPVVAAHVDVQVEYGVEAYPTGFLIAPNGRVLWRGSPDRMTDRVFEAYLRKFPVRPEAPGRFEWCAELFAESRYGELITRLEADRQCRRVSDEECRFVLGTLTWLEGYATSLLQAAQRDVDAGRVHDAWWTYDHLASAFPDSETADRAGAARDALVGEPTRRREIEAFEALRKARRTARAQGAPGARTLEAVALGHPGTRAAHLARALAVGWRAR